MNPMNKQGLRHGATRLPYGVQARMGGLYTTLVRRARNRTLAEPPLFRREFGEIVQYRLSPTGLLPRDNERFTLDIFCWAYTPGPGDVVVDVGAGTGEETVTFCRLVGSSGTVVSVEAHPVVHQALDKTVTANGLDNCITVQAAVAATACSIDMETDTLDWVGNSVHATAGSDTVTVPALPLQEILSNAGLADSHIDLLKVNIEGAETDVLAAAGSALERVHNVAVSCHDFKAQNTGDPRLRTYTQVAQILRDAGFALRARADSRPWVADVVYGTRT